MSSQQISINAKSVKNVNLPLKTKCTSCLRVKNLAQFSNKQLNILRERILRIGQANAVPKDGLLRCADCSGQNVEMKCCRCMRTMSLDAFSLAQRRNKDHAVCFLCMEESVDFDTDYRRFGTADRSGRALSMISDDQTLHEEDAHDIYDWNKESGNYTLSEASSSVASVDGGVSISRAASTGHSRTPMSSVDSTRAGSSAEAASDDGSGPRTVSSVVGSSKWLSERESQRAIRLTTTNLQQMTFDKPEPPQPACPGPPSVDWGVPVGPPGGQQPARPDANAPSAVSALRAGAGGGAAATFRGYDPQGTMHIQQREPTGTPGSSGFVTRAGNTTASSASGLDTSRPSAPGPQARSERFARIRPSNEPIRRFKPLARPEDMYGKPKAALVTVDSMEDFSSDED